MDGGADTVIDSFLGEGCTLLVPTFSWEAHSTLPSADAPRPGRNGTDYGSPHYHSLVPNAALPFTTKSDEIDLNMGLVAATLVRRPGRLRGNHPLCSFSAVGPLAQHLISGQSGEDVFAPLNRISELDGFAVLAGVGLNRLTALHLAEQLSGRNMFVRWAQVSGGVVAVRVGGCSDGFERLKDGLARHQLLAEVGVSRWRILPVAKLLQEAVALISANPDITRCHDPSCLRCPDAIRGGPGD